MDKKVSAAPQFQDLIDAIKRNGISRQQWENILCVNKSIVLFIDQDRRTMLHHTAFHGRTSLIELLVQQDVELNSYNKNGETPLFVAVVQDKVAAVEALLKAGADPEVRNQYGETLLHVACNSKTGILELLLKHCDCYIDAANAEEQTPLHYAVMLEREDAVETLLNFGANVNVADAKGRMPLHMASSRGLLKTLNLLLSHGAYVNACDNHDKIPLHYAVQFGHMSLVQALVQQGAKINAIDMDGIGDTPLEVAIDASRLDIVLSLLQQGALQKETLLLVSDVAYPGRSPAELNEEYQDILAQYQEVGNPTRADVLWEVEQLLIAGKSIDNGESQEFKNVMFKLMLCEQKDFLHSMRENQQVRMSESA
ncbi:MAG: ankyrin repeat domain-containing protein [Alphaproteobacteria bacterium]|nr:ankyrin repeat domain-containing protein [Alphaproteobacteria bacterium]